MSFDKMMFGAASTYETPQLKTLDITSEGVLCASGDFSISDWEKDDDVLDF